MVVRSAAVDVVIVDSVAALTPKAEIEGEMGDHHVGLQARLMSQALRKMAGNIKNSNTLVVFINQIRMKIGVMFGSPETTTGGNALKFYSSVRLDIRRIGSIKEGDEIVGNETRVKVIKNKVAPFSNRQNFRLCTERASTGSEKFLIWVSRSTLLTKQVLGIAIRVNGLGKGKRTLANF